MRVALCGLLVLPALVACGLPCSADADCISGYVCRGQACTPATAVSGSSSGGDSGGGSTSGGASSSNSSSSNTGSGSTSGGGTSSSGGGTSSSSGGGASSSSGGADTCATPQLFVLINSNDGAVGNKGAVHRLSIGAAGTTPCNVLRLGSGLSNQVLSVGFADGKVLVGSLSGVTAIDPVGDYQHWFFSTDRLFNFATSVMSMRAPREDGTVINAVLVNMVQSWEDPRPGDVTILNASNGAEMHRWATRNNDSPFFLNGSPVAVTAHPREDGHLMTASSATPQLIKRRIPFPGQTAQSSTYLQTASMPGPQGMTAVAVGNVTRFVVRAPFGNNNDVIAQVLDDGTAPVVRSPYVCSAHCGAPMDYGDAIADPATADGVFATCLAPGSNSVRHVVRIQLGGACQLVLNGNDLASQTYAYRLAVRP
jgi:hypothetical protein